ncbi:MAG TPA: hypothetical protein VNL38_03420 [Candidatus Nitrosotenuis sp.]|nr:hypothetical protein [Candidatus Nitrosotenuis sp.]
MLPTLEIQAVAEERCMHRSPKGYRCRNAAISGSEVCAYHAGPEFQPWALMAPEILMARHHLETADDVRALLARIARALVNGRLQPKQANTLTYIAQTLLASLERKEEQQRLGF